MDKGLTATGKPRRRRYGAGRPYKHGEPTRSIRVPISVPTDLCSAIPELQAIIDHWETEAGIAGDNPRYYFLRKLVEEIRGLGF
jgi:hypothetical protein